MTLGFATVRRHPSVELVRVENRTRVKLAAIVLWNYGNGRVACKMARCRASCRSNASPNKKGYAMGAIFFQIIQQDCT